MLANQISPFLFLINTKDINNLEMDFKENKKVFDPKKIYKDEPNPTEL